MNLCRVLPVVELQEVHSGILRLFVPREVQYSVENQLLEYVREWFAQAQFVVGLLDPSGGALVSRCALEGPKHLQGLEEVCNELPGVGLEVDVPEQVVGGSGEGIDDVLLLLVPDPLNVNFCAVVEVDGGKIGLPLVAEEVGEAREEVRVLLKRGLRLH